MYIPYSYTQPLGVRGGAKTRDGSLGRLVAGGTTIKSLVLILGGIGGFTRGLVSEFFGPKYFTFQCW